MWVPPQAPRQIDRRGRILSEVFASQGEFDPLQQFWRQQGWDVAETYLPTTSKRHLRCEKQGVVWHAWWNRRDDGRTTLLLIREPDA